MRAAGTLSGTPLSPAVIELDRELSAELPLALEAEGFLGATPAELKAYVRLDCESAGDGSIFCEANCR